MPVPEFPGALSPSPWFWFLDETFQPMPLGKLYTYEAGTVTPLAVYQDANLSAAHPNPVIANASGYATIFLGASAYKFRLHDPDDVFIREVDGIEDLGQIFANQIGLILGAGTRDVEEGYEITADDILVTVNSSTSVATPCPVILPDVTARTMPITIKNVGVKTVAITPQSGQTIEGLAAAYVIPAFSSPMMPTVRLLPAADGYWIDGGIGIT